MKKKIKIVLLVVILLAAVYLGEGFYISRKIFTVVKSSFATEGIDNPYSDVVSDELYAKMCVSNTDQVTWELRSVDTGNSALSFPLTLHWLVGGKSVYWYSYEIYNSNGVQVDGTWYVPVTVETRLEGGHWVITALEEHVEEADPPQASATSAAEVGASSAAS